MIKRISESNEIFSQLKRDKKNITINMVAYNEATEKLNKEMEAVRRDYKHKDSTSQKSASQVVLTA